jgi:hydroxyethylthiazole kinase-like uncharacterized protein yjeF
MALVLTAAQMRAVDQAAIAAGVPGLVLMENAGRGVAEIVARRCDELAGARVGVLCGGGQNGGDGFVIARHLANRGAEVQAWLVAPRARIAGDALVFLQAAERTRGVRVEDQAADGDEGRWRARLAGAAVLVDAVYGTGLRADVTGPPAAALAAFNAAGALRVAVDIPSGLDADSGRPRGCAARADVTATMGALKLGLVIDAAAPVGALEVVDLGVSVAAFSEAAARLGPLCHYLDRATVAGLLHAQGPAGHKGTRGHALLIAGSAGKTGAGVLAARGALRAGAGLATIASTAAGQAALDAKVLEPMTACYAAGDDADGQSYQQVLELARRMKAAAVGPGMPVGPGARALAHRLAAELPLPLVIDADGLNLLGGEAGRLLRGAPAPRVLTPHPGEMARLAGLDTPSVQGDRLGVCRRLAADTGAVVVLKGARTVIAGPDGTAYINPAADPSLGTAGSGDVLTGVITGLLAQGLAPVDAVRAAVFVHGEAAAEARRQLGSRNIVAGELPDAVARVIEAQLLLGQAHRH